MARRKRFSWEEREGFSWEEEPLPPQEPSQEERYPFLEEFDIPEPEAEKPLWQYPAEFLLGNLEKLTTMGGAVLTAPLRAKELGELAREAPVVSPYPGGRGYEQYEEWKAEQKGMPTLIPSGEQIGAWLRPAVELLPEKSFRYLYEHIGTEIPEPTKGYPYQLGRMRTPDVAEWIPWIAVGGLGAGEKPALEFLMKTAQSQMAKGKTAEEAISFATEQAIRKGKIPAGLGKPKALPVIKPEAKVERAIAEARAPTTAPMPTIKELILASYKPTLASKVGQKLTQLPGVFGSLSRRLLPMQAARTDAEKAAIAWMGQREIAPSLARIEMDAVYAQNSPFFVDTITGLVRNVKSKTPAHKPIIGAITEFPDRYVLTQAQRRELDLLDDILRTQLARELEAGVAIKPLALKEGQRYFPRFVREVQDLETKAIKEVRMGVKTRPGGKPSSFKERYYEEILDGILKGKRYSTDYRAAVEMRLSAGNRAMADKMLADYLAPLGRLPKETIDVGLVMGTMEIRSKRVALRQISELIEHINAKESIAWYRWLGIKTTYPEQYAILRNVAKTGEKVSQELKKWIVSEKKSLTEVAKETLAKYTVELRRARRPILGREGQIEHAGLQGRLFPVELAEPTNALIRGEITPHQALQAFGKLNAVARMGQTAIDTGFMFIQLLMNLYNHPGSWFRAFGMVFQTLKNPKHWARFSQTHKAMKSKIATHGGAPFGGTEYTEAARAGGWLVKIPLLGRLFRRFGLAFENSIDTARVLITEAREARLVHKFGRELSDRELTELVTSVDHMVGISSLRRLGISGFIRDLASNTLYAPRYYVAFVSFLSQAFQGGIGGNIAREALAKFIVGISTTMTALAYALGQEDRVIPTEKKPIPKMFDPRTGEFMTVEIGGTHMGLGGVWIAGFRLIGSLVRTAQDDPSRFVSIDPHENPLLRYGYGRASPVASAAIDVITGRNFLGERLDTPMDYLHELVDKTFPFWLAGQITDVPKPGWEKGTAEWWGLRSWMVQYREQANDWVNEHIKDIPQGMIMPWQKDQDLTYEDLNNEQRAWLLENFADYRELVDKVKEDKLRRGTDFQVMNALIKNELDESYHNELKDLVRGMKKGEITILDYLNQAEYERRIRQGQYQYRALAEQYMDEKRLEDLERWLAENEKPEDVLYDKYMELRGNPPKAFGSPDWEAWERQLEGFMASIPEENRTYIERRREDWIQNLPAEAQPIEAILLWAGKFYNVYYAADIGKARLALREKNPTLDAALILSGRVTTFKSKEALRIVREILKRFGLPETAIPAFEKVEVVREKKRFSWERAGGGRGRKKFSWE